jgi:hypothetical protein
MKKNRQTRFSILRVLVLLLPLLALLWWLTGGLSCPRGALEKARKVTCLNNLRMLDQGTESWFLANKKRSGDAIDVPAVCNYVRGDTLPTCVAGGTYTLPPVGESPRCSLHGGLWEGRQDIPLFWDKVHRGRKLDESNKVLDATSL